MSLPSLAFMAAQALRRRAQQPGAQPMMPPPEEDGLAAFMREDENPLRVPTMRAEDPDFLKYQLEPLDDEQKGLQGQLQQAQAMMAGGGNRATTPLGAAIGGIADLIRGGVGAYRQKGLQAQMASLGQRRAEAVEAFGRNPSESAVPRDEPRKGRLLQRALQANQQAFQGGENEKGRVLQRTLEGMQGARAREKAAADKTAGLSKAENDLRDEMQKNPLIKNAMVAGTAFRQLKAAPRTGVGDLQRIFAYTNMIDPSVAVKQEDVLNIGRAGGLPFQVQGYFNQLTAQGTLADQVRKEMEEAGVSIMAAKAAGVAPLRSEYRRLATERGADPNRVDINLGLDFQSAVTPPAPQRTQAPLPPARGGVVGPGDPRNPVSKEVKDGVETVIYADGSRTINGKRFVVRDGAWHEE